MSIKFGLLALLTAEPMYGAQLKSEFEHRTGGTWPLNIGQVYTTLSRLERDALVVHDGEPDAEGRRPYRLTQAGGQVVGTWWQTPVERSVAPRDELAIKLALAVTAPGVDVRGVVQRQRAATLRHMQGLTRLKRQAEPEPELAWTLVLDHLVFDAEAEIRWLDHVEARLAREVGRGSPPPPRPETQSTPAAREAGR